MQFYFIERIILTSFPQVFYLFKSPLRSLIWFYGLQHSATIVGFATINLFPKAAGSHLNSLYTSLLCSRRKRYQVVGEHCGTFSSWRVIPCLWSYCIGRLDTTLHVPVTHLFQLRFVQWRPRCSSIHVYTPVNTHLSHHLEKHWEM